MGCELGDEGVTRQIRDGLLDSTVCRRRGLDLPLCSCSPLLSERVSRWRLRCCLLGAIRSLELTVGAALEHQVVSSAEEPIQSAFSQDGVGEQWVPILGRAIAGQDHRAGTSAFADQLVQVIRLLGGVGL